MCLNALGDVGIVNADFEEEKDVNVSDSNSEPIEGGKDHDELYFYTKSGAMSSIPTRTKKKAMRIRLI